MKNNKSFNFFFGIIAIILGWTLFKQFDFQTMRFRHTGLGIVYLAGFVFSVYFLIKRKSEDEK